MAGPDHRYYVIPPGGEQAIGYHDAEAARAVARECGEGAQVVDTAAMPYHPMVERVEQGEPVYLEFGAWDTRVGVDRNLIEAVKKGHVPIVRAFLAKGADAKAADEGGGTALIWAVARGRAETVRLLLDSGAEVNARDADGTTALALARRRNAQELAEILLAVGAEE